MKVSSMEMYVIIQAFEKEEYRKMHCGGTKA